MYLLLQRLVLPLKLFHLRLVKRRLIADLLLQRVDQPSQRVVRRFEALDLLVVCRAA